MRRYLLLLFTITALLVVLVSHGWATTPHNAEVMTPAPVAVQRATLATPRALTDEAIMVLLGTALISLGAAVRRAA